MTAANISQGNCCQEERTEGLEGTAFTDQTEKGLVNKMSATCT